MPKVLDMLFKLRTDVSELKKANNSLAQTSRRMNALKSRFKNGLIQGAGIAATTTAINGLKGALRATVSEGINFSAMVEQQTVALESLLGTITDAKDRIKELVNFSATTPFRFREIIEADKVLESLSGGALSTSEGMTLIGDTAAALGQPLKMVSMWMGRLYAGLQTGTPIGEATLRLLEMGVVSGDLKRQLEQLAKTANGSQKAMQIMVSSFGKYDGAMEKQSRTFNGLMSTMKEVFSIKSAEAMKPFFNALKSMLEGTLISMGVLTDETGTYLNKLEKRLAEITRMSKTGSPELASEASQDIEVLQSNLEAAEDALEKLNKLTENPDDRSGFEKILGGIFGTDQTYAEDFAKDQEDIFKRLAKSIPEFVGDGSDLTIEKVKDLRKRFSEQIEAIKKEQELSAIDVSSLTEDELKGRKGELEGDNSAEGLRESELIDARLLDIERERSLLGDKLLQDSEKLNQAEFDLLMNYDQQVAYLKDRIEALKNEKQEKSTLFDDEEKHKLLMLQYDTQIAELQQQMLDVQKDREGIVDDALNNFFGDIDQQGADQYLGKLKKIENQKRNIRRASRQISSEIVGLIKGTTTWQQTLGNIATTILETVLSAIIETFATQVAKMLFVHQLGETLKAQETATTTAQAAETTAAWTPAAVVSSIGSFGGALAFGAIALALIAGLSGGFAEGGYTGPGSKYTPVGIVHAGEYVVPKNIVEKVGAGYFDGLMGDIQSGNNGFTSSGSAQQLISMDGSSSGGSSHTTILVDDVRSDVKRAMESADGKATIRKVVRGMKNELRGMA